ncbi:MAG: hypothetical protein M3406_14440 [Chloroflexota bacterium]|nr:hypothetical protein [Chloroflexota bacterium]
MFRTRIARAALGGLVLSAMLAGPVSAAKPTRPPTEPISERPLTSDELAAAERKIVASDLYLASVAADGTDLMTLSCVTPTGDSTQAETEACYVPQGYVSVEARDQTKSIYCGPATGQVIANYSWAVGSGGNKYTQAKIAGWMQTDINGGTSAPELEDGLELGTQNSPRRPAGWDWVVSDVRDRNDDGHTGDELQGFVRSNVSSSKMPLAIPVKPHDPNSRYYLISWAKPVVSIGHWIAAYGWYGNYTGTTFARIYYTDSSRDEGGSTGKFWDPTRDIAALIAEHTRRIVW